MSDIIANVYRGDLIESIHYGDIAVVGKNGKLMYQVGQSDRITYWRSAAKPLQVIPLFLSGAVEEYNLTEKEIAVMTASHNGEDQHVEVVMSILDKIGLDESALLCGLHQPYHKPTARLLLEKGEELSPIRNNCSGKHAGLLTLCQFHGWDLNTYYEKDHPAQQMILDVISDITDYPVDKIIRGEDGCGVVVFGLPLKNMAHAYSRLANPETLPEKYREAAERITECMEKYPEMVGGTGRFNTDLMNVTGDKLVAKMGAEGIFSIGVHGGMGITVKVGDGNKRAVPPATLEVLVQLGILTDEQLEKLAKYYHKPVLNHRKNEVGRIIPVFKMSSM